MTFSLSSLQFIKRIIITMIAFVFLISTQLNALEAKDSFRAQNGVLYSGDGSCETGTGAKGDSTQTTVTGSENGWVFPTAPGTPISSEFHEDRGYAHRGVDLAGPMGSPIYASRDGKVLASGSASGFGNWIVIQHDVDGKRVDSVYGHMKSGDLMVKTGDTVKAGQQISRIGSEGESSGPHLHYEEWEGGRPDFGGSGPERKPEAVYGKSGTATGGSDADANPVGTTESATPTSCCGGGTSSTSTTSGGGGGCGEQGYASGNRDSKANKDQIWSFFKSKGLSDIAVAGIMGNIDQESAFMPDANNNNNAANQGAVGGGCRGIVQWCASRNTDLQTFADQKGQDWTCLGTQLEFVWHELENTGEGAVMTNLNAAKTPGDAGNVWAVEYERMATYEQTGRAERAEKIYEDFTGKSADTLGDSASSCAPKKETSAEDKV